MMNKSNTKLTPKRRSRPLFALGVAFAVAVSFACTFVSYDDSYVDASKPSNNYGSSGEIRVKGSPLQTAYLKFPVVGAQSHDSAVLRVYSLNGGSDLSVYAVANTSWSESTITANNAPPVGALLDTVTSLQADTAYSLDVSALVTQDGVYSFALRTSGNGVIKLSSSEGLVEPALIVPAPAEVDSFSITRNASTYTAAGSGGSPVYTGSAKVVVEQAVVDLDTLGGGTISFAAGTFDFGTDHLELSNLENITFEGQGMGVTTLTNNTSEADDTEVFDVVGADGVTIRDMTVSANGAFRSTSDAIDFDNGNNSTVERLEVTGSRGRGIVFDGKGAGWSAEGNTISDCVITGVPSDGIELLAASNNTVTGCTVTGVGTNPTLGGHGIQLTKSSTSAVQPNKQSNNNTVTNNTIDQSGSDGININSGSTNTIGGNLITNSSNVKGSKDGIRIQSSNSIACDGNTVLGNTATDNQSPKTQRYGLNISSSLCVANIVGVGNNFTGNKTGAINDLGTSTVYL